MKSALVLLFVFAACAAQNLAEDDGSWKPHLDNSALGNGDLVWLGPDQDDGSYKPQLYNAGTTQRRRRSTTFVNPNALPVPADELTVALAKEAHLVQQHNEATRNVLGGGVPVALPADTPEVALGKQAHAIAHANQVALTSGALLAAAPVAARLATPYAAHLATPLAAPLVHSSVHALHAPLATPLVHSVHAPLAGVRAFW